MAITTNTNISSLNAQRQLERSTSGLNTAFQRLSSGSRINKAADDAAGLIISEGILAELEALGQATRNASDGLSFLDIGDGALEQAGVITQRLTELAEQSANGTLNNTQRFALNQEFVALSSELDRLSGSTTFNGQAVLGNTLNLQTGTDSDPNSQTQVAIGQVNTSSLGLAGANISNQANALDALERARSATAQIAQSRGTIGAGQATIGVQINNIATRREALAGANSRIRDADIAAEASNLAAARILQQGGASVLAQANQQPGLALRLLGNRT